jgi:hypothetical protein
VGPETPVTPVVPVDLAARSPVDPAGPVTLVDPGDMNRVVAATVGTAAVTAPADLASRAVPVVRVGMIPEDPVDMIPGDPVGLVVRVGMILGDPVGLVVRVGMILGDPEGRLRAPNPVVRVDPERLVVTNPVARVEPGNREATDLSLGRALPVRMPMRRVRMPMRLHLTAARPPLMPALLHLTAARRLPMPALLHLTPADRRRDPTTRAVATCQEARIRLVAVTRPAEGIPRVEATHSAERQNRNHRHVCLSRAARRFRTRPYNGSRTLARPSVSYRRSWVPSPDEENRTYRCNHSRHRRFGVGRPGRGTRRASPAWTVPAVVSR